MTQLYVDTLANEAGTGPTELTKQSAAKTHAKHDDAAGFDDDRNISSGTDVGTGDYEFNLTNSVVNSDTTIVQSVQPNTGDSVGGIFFSNTSTVSIDCFEASGGSRQDNPGSFCAFGTLA
jgi:hypothetical protein